VIVKTDAVVLRTRKFRESSKIVTLYTREHGKVGVVARGVVRPKSKYGSALQPMAFLSTVFYRKEGRDLHNLSIAEPLERFNVLSGSLERLSAGMAIVEIVEAAMHDEDRNVPLFDALVEALRMLDDPTANEQSVGLWFQIRLATILGYAIRTDECGVCDEPIVRESRPVPYSISIGAPLCAEHREEGSSRTLSAAAFDLLRDLSVRSVAEGALLRPDERSVMELGDALNAFIRFHVEGLRRLKVRGVSAKVLDDVVPLA